MKQLVTSAHERKNIFVKTDSRIERIALSEVLCIEGMKDYLKIITSTRKIVTRMSFGTILSHLPQDEFVRVHNSFVVRIDSISSIEKNRIQIGDLRDPH